jgi:YrbI family 3-deoxy-D-manno-octulosonate 8-phosphate phosphatase
MKLPDPLRPDLFALLPERPAILVLDFDGVMTDDRVYVDQDGRETVCCTRGDGLGLTLLRRAEFPVLVLSTEANPVVAARCRKVKVECIQGCPDKTLELERILVARGIPAERMVFIGNDVNDIGCLRRAGCGLVPADAHPLARGAARGILSKPGGRGAVREAAEMILLRLGRDLLYNESDRKG